MSLYPLFADLAGREVLVVGGGEVAARKIAALLKAGALIRLHAQEIAHDDVAAWLRAGTIQRLPGEFDPAWLDVVWLVVAATDDVAFNAHLADEAGRRRRLVNVVDDAVLSTFQVPALVDRSPLMVAISTAGTAPMLARRLRERLEVMLDPGLGALAGLFGRHRARIREALPDMRARRRWFEQMLDGRIEASLGQGDAAGAEAVFLSSLEGAAGMDVRGSVTLVIAPDDADLLTLRALRALNEADTIIVGRGVGERALEPARRDAHRVVADRDPVGQTMALASEGAHVVLALPRADPALAAALKVACAREALPCTAASTPLI